MTAHLRAAWAARIAGSGLLAQIQALRPQLAQAAQKVIDEWTQDEEGYDEVFGGGGVCDAVAEAMTDVLVRVGGDIHNGGQDGDDHAWLVVVKGDDVVGVDIPPGVYETGGGYSWRKIPGAQVHPENVEVWDLDIPASEFEDEW